MKRFCYLCGAEATETKPNYYTCPTDGPLWLFSRNAPCADALILNDSKDQILLVQRANDPDKGTWALPGGFQEFGEHPADAARREALEETGVTIEIDELFSVHLHHVSPHETRQVTVHLAHAVSGQPTAGDDAQDCRWFPLADLPENLMPAHRPQIENYIQTTTSRTDR